MGYKTLSELEASISIIRQSPVNNGAVALLVRRPKENQREVVNTAIITRERGMDGDNWQEKPSSSSADGGPHPDKQITLMNSRAIAAITGDKTFWPPAGDQIFVDLQLGYENLPPGTLLQVGGAILRVSEPPHRGCKKFAERFGQDAMRFVNSEVGRELNLRGINCSVIQSGEVHLGDFVYKISQESIL